MAEFLEAYEMAQARQDDPWQFALGIQGLWEAGIRDTELYWLNTAGYIEHGLEETVKGSPRRQFSPAVNHRITPDSCFVLAEAAVALVRRLLLFENGPEGPALGRPLPSWDEKNHRLLLGKVVVKVFRRPAPIQQMVLRSFEELGWPERMDNPLGSERGRSGEERLHDAINGLNRRQQNPVLRFRADGTGEGVAWKANP